MTIKCILLVDLMAQSKRESDTLKMFARVTRKKKQKNIWSQSTLSLLALLAWFGGHFIFKRPETFNNRRYMSRSSNNFYTIAAIRCDILPAKSKFCCHGLEMK
mgnify:CR=1 FL=1